MEGWGKSASILFLTEYSNEEILIRAQILPFLFKWVRIAKSTKWLLVQSSLIDKECPGVLPWLKAVESDGEAWERNSLLP